MFLIRLLSTPPHLKYVATLPCNVSFHKVTYARCGGNYSNQFTANLPRNLLVKKIVNRLRFDRIVAMSLWPHFWPTLYNKVETNRRSDSTLILTVLNLIQSPHVRLLLTIVRVCKLISSYSLSYLHFWICYSVSVSQISTKLDHNFLSFPTNRQIDNHWSKHYLANLWWRRWITVDDSDASEYDKGDELTCAKWGEARDWLERDW